MARAGLLDGRNHTSSAREYLAATGYAGGDHYIDERAIVDGNLITAGPQSPVQFARATMGRLGLAPERTLEAYEALFDRGDQAAYPVLMQERGSEVKPPVLQQRPPRSGGGESDLARQPEAIHLVARQSDSC